MPDGELAEGMGMRLVQTKDRGYEKTLSKLDRRAAPTESVAKAVRAIIDQVAENGDAALCNLTLKFDRADLAPTDLRVTAGEFEEAESLIDTKTRDAIAISHQNVTAFAEASKRRDWEMTNAQGAVVGERFQPFQRVGLYVPGGTAPLVSTSLMTVAIGKAAGVPELVVTTPCGANGKVNPALLYALRISGATEVYKVGGAQAIAALAYGTETIAPVVKIFGPGNSFVVEAKRQCVGLVSIDLLPGPSEIAVLADETADPSFVASDLLAQAEHDAESVVLVVSESVELLQKIKDETEQQVETLPRREIAERALSHSLLVQAKSLDHGVGLINDFAPEHLSLVIADPDPCLSKLTTSGGIFVGPYSPVACGDFLAGPSHTLPTGGAGRSFSGLTVDQFQRRTSVVRLDREALAASRPVIKTFCRIEGLEAHARSASIRLSDKEGGQG